MLPMPSERIISKRVGRLVSNPYGAAEFWLLTNGQVWMTEPNGKDPWHWVRGTLADFIDYAKNHEFKQIVLEPEYLIQADKPIQLRLL